MASKRFETTLRGPDLEAAERNFKASGQTSRAAFTRQCLIAGPAGHDPELQDCIANVGLLSSMLRSGLEDGMLGDRDLGRALGELVLALREIVKLLRKKRT